MLENQHIVDNLIQIQEQFRIFHWQTKSFARHDAFGSAYDSFSGLIDTFVEIHMGKYGRIMTGGMINLSNLSPMNLSNFLIDTETFLLGLTDKLDSKKDTDLLNIRDEMLAAVNKIKYLLTLK